MIKNFRVIKLLLSFNLLMFSYELNCKPKRQIYSDKSDTLKGKKPFVGVKTKTEVNIREPEAFARYYLRKVLTNPDFYKIMIALSAMAYLKKKAGEIGTSFTKKVEGVEKQIQSTAKDIKSIPERTAAGVKSGAISVVQSVGNTASTAKKAVVSTAEKAANEAKAALKSEAHKLSTSAISLVNPEKAKEIIKEDIKKRIDEAKIKMETEESEAKKQFNEKQKKLREDLETIRKNIEEKQIKTRETLKQKPSMVRTKEDFNDYSKLADEFLREEEMNK